jgi:hypothetical protein
MPRSIAPESDDGPLQASDLEVLQEEEEREKLLGKPTSGLQSFLRARDRDPNAPRQMTRREQRKQRRRDRRAKRRKGKDEEGGLIYELGAHRGGSDSSSSSLHEFSEGTDLGKVGRSSCSPPLHADHF